MTNMAPFVGSDACIAKTLAHPFRDVNIGYSLRPPFGLPCGRYSAALPSHKKHPSSVQTVTNMALFVGSDA